METCEKIGTTSAVEKEREIPFERIIAKLKLMYSVKVSAGQMEDFRELCAEIWGKKIWTSQRNQSPAIRREIQKKFRAAGFPRFFDNKIIGVCEVVFADGELRDDYSPDGRKEVRALHAEVFCEKMRM